MIHNYNDFLEALIKAGFSMAGGNSEGIYSIINWGWLEEPPYETPISWHTEDPETDPWEWRMRVLEERDDIAYAKLFFKKSGYITKEWYPYFLAARRGNDTFEELYGDGKISHFAKRIYQVVLANETLSVPEIKSLARFTREDKAGFDRALTELQMGMFLTMCGRQFKPNNSSWSSTVFCTTERFFGDDVFDKTATITPEEAVNKITEQILNLNPSVQENKINKFILG